MNGIGAALRLDRQRPFRREDEPEGAAPAVDGLRADRPAVQLHESLAEREPEPGALLLAARGAVHLAELDEQPLGIFRPEPDPRVADRDPDRVAGEQPRLALVGGRRDRERRLGAHQRQPDLPRFRRELGGVGEQVDEHLLDAQPVGQRHELAVVHLDAAVLLADRAEARRVGDRLPDRFPQVGGRQLEAHRARLDLGKIEHAVDQVEQVPAVPQHGIEEFPLLRVDGARRLGDRSAPVQDDGHLRIQQQREERPHVLDRLAIDDHGFVVGRDLHHAEDRSVGPLPDELGIEGHPAGCLNTSGEGPELRGSGEEGRGFGHVRPQVQGQGGRGNQGGPPPTAAHDDRPGSSQVSRR